MITNVHSRVAPPLTLVVHRQVSAGHARTDRVPGYIDATATSCLPGLAPQASSGLRAVWQPMRLHRRTNAGGAPDIHLIVTDVDGTLLDSQQQLADRTLQAVRAAAAVGVPVRVTQHALAAAPPIRAPAPRSAGPRLAAQGACPPAALTPPCPTPADCPRCHAAQLVVATGKARGPWVGDVLPHIAPMPGVFLQGLLICDAQGGTLYTRCLDADVALDCMGMASDLGLTLTVYSDDHIFCAAVDQHTDRLLFYRWGPPGARCWGLLAGANGCGCTGEACTGIA